MQALVWLQRISRNCDRGGFRRFSRLIDLVSRLAFSAALPGRAMIGENVFFHHSGLGVVVNGASIIERDCEIGVHVVLGGRAPNRGAPHLERGVIVHAGAKIIGPVRVGAGSVVGANAVVLRDVPARCLVVGIPAAIKRREIDSAAYRRDAETVRPSPQALDL